MKELYVKIKESLVSALPITLIVYVLALTPWFNPTGAELIMFSISAVMLIVGLGLFSLGADLAMTPLIAIQLLGFRAVISQRIRERRAMKRILDADDQQIINFL